MSKGNPDKAMTALLPLPIRVSGGYSVNPMTLGMFAALERIKSPLVNPDIHDGDMLDLIPSLYLLTHDPLEVFKADLIVASMDWANTVPPTILAEIQTAAYKQINAALDVVPEKKKTIRTAVMTDGSRRSSTSQRKRSTGATKK